MLTLNGTLVLGPNFTLLRKVERSLPARSSTPTAARRLRARAHCESGKLCLQSHLLVPVSSAREPLCTTTVLKCSPKSERHDWKKIKHDGYAVGVKDGVEGGIAYPSRFWRTVGEGSIFKRGTHVPIT
jgi:hypothetical protein